MAQQTTPVIIPLAIRCKLGEGPLWDAGRQVIHWVDILSGHIHEFNPATGQHQCRDAGDLVGAVTLLDDGNFLAALKSGLVTIDRSTGAQQPVAHPEAHLPGNRYNDGKCDPQGRFWIGSMALDETAVAGSLYRLDADMICRRMVNGVGISNGLAWSPDQRTMYYIDTPDQAVTAFDFDPETGNIENRRIAFTIPEAEGFPDGMCIDSEGMLWIAHWDGWQVARWDPATGAKLQAVEFPAARITSCCFGGAGLDELYVTSARVGLSEEELEKQPDAGALFVVSGVGCRGVPQARFQVTPQGDGSLSRHRGNE